MRVETSEALQIIPLLDLQPRHCLPESPLHVCEQLRWNSKLQIFPRIYAIQQSFLDPYDLLFESGRI